MGTHNLSSEQIATAVSQAEDLAREGRYEEAGQCAIATLPEITTGIVPIDIERSRLKLRIYHVLHVCPGMEFVDADHEEMSYIIEEVLGNNKKNFSPSELVRAYLLSQMCESSADPREKAQQEKREFDALEAAQKVLEAEENSSYEKALAHFLVCFVTPDNDQAEDHLRQLFAIHHEGRPLMTTVGSCTGVHPTVHIKTGFRFLDRAIKEARDVPQYYTKLLRAKIHSLILQLGDELDPDARSRWYHDHEEEFYALATELLMHPDSSLRTRALTHLSLCIYALMYKEHASAELHLGIAATIAQQSQDQELIHRVAEHREMLYRQEEEEENEDEEEDDDWWKHGGEAPV